MKVGRHSKIIELVNNNDIETQEDLADLLTKAGYNVTQATISRDIRELKLTKISLEDGKQKYIILNTPSTVLSEKYIRVLKDGFMSMDMAQNIIVIKTVSGMAMAVAAALDALNVHGILGCIAGDDTVMCVIKTTEETIFVTEKLSKLINSKNL